MSGGAQLTLQVEWVVKLAMWVLCALIDCSPFNNKDK